MVGSQGLERAAQKALVMSVQSSAEIAVAYVRESFRGAGLGVQLRASDLALPLSEKTIERCSSDWQ